MPHRPPVSDMAPRPPWGHHDARNGHSSPADHPGLHASVCAGAHARPAAARAYALAPLGRAWAALGGDGPRAHRVVAGGVRGSPAAGTEPRPLFRLSLAVAPVSRPSRVA